jgi:hypothetical protein
LGFQKEAKRRESPAFAGIFAVYDADFNRLTKNGFVKSLAD